MVVFSEDTSQDEMVDKTIDYRKSIGSSQFIRHPISFLADRPRNIRVIVEKDSNRELIKLGIKAMMIVDPMTPMSREVIGPYPDDNIVEEWNALIDYSNTSDDDDDLPVRQAAYEKLQKIFHRNKALLPPQK